MDLHLGLENSDLSGNPQISGLASQGAQWMLARPLELVGSGLECRPCHLLHVYDCGKMIALSLSFLVCEVGVTAPVPALTGDVRIMCACLVQGQHTAHASYFRVPVIRKVLPCKVGLLGLCRPVGSQE